MKYLSTLFILIIILIGCAKKITSSAIAPAVNKPAMLATVPTNKDSLQISAMMAEGKQIFSTKCIGCHELIPAENYTAARWVNIMESMAQKARLDATEKANVLLYVKYNARNAHS